MPRYIWGNDLHFSINFNFFSQLCYLFRYSLIICCSIYLPLAHSTSTDFFSYGLYLRSGVGSNFKGGDQECFNNPGTPGNEFRLGNECQNYGELVLTGHPIRADEQSQTYVKAQVRLAFSQDGDTNWEGANSEDPIAVRESFVEIGGIDNSPISFWAGKRFYRENDLHMNDFYYFADTSGNGGGIGHIPFLRGHLHLAWLRENSQIQTDKGKRALNLFDARIKGLQIAPGHNLNLWLGYAYVPSAIEVDSQSELASHSGKVFGVLHDWNLNGGFNHLALLYGQGLMREFNLYAPLDTVKDSIESRRLKDSRRFRLVEHLSMEVGQDFAFHFATTFEWRDNGNSDEGEVWWNVGVRPVYFFTDHYQIAFEAGTSIVNRKGEDLRRLTRFTIAPQVATSRSLWGRPVVRAFVSRSFWSRSNRGDVGAIAYENSTSGGSFGLHIEAWF